jgi:acyl-CoA synthetase (AMP-forming)/AMP-acid ligase II
VEFNLADLFECVAAQVPQREAVVWGGTRLTFRQFDDRATQLAHGLRAMGIGPGSHVGILTYSRPEYLETMVAAFKIRAVPINVNYRYVADELAYLFDNADLEALVLEAAFAPVVAGILERLPRLAHLIIVDDGSDGASALPGAVAYEDVISAESTLADFPARSGDDVYIAYTGGTTGMPKGVVWRQEDIFFATMTPGVEILRPEDIAANAVAPVHPRRIGCGRARDLRLVLARPPHARQRSLVRLGRHAEWRPYGAPPDAADGRPYRPWRGRC